MVSTSPAPGGMPLGELDPRTALLCRNWSFVLWRAIAAIVFGVLAIVWPGLTLASLILLFAAYMLVDGVFTLLSGLRAARAHERWGWFLFEGLVDIAAAVVAFAWPGMTVIVFTWLVGFWAVVTGVLMLAAAFRLHGRHGRWLLAISGIVSVLWGALLLFLPLAGALVMTLWVGAYALVFGISLLVFALRLRRARGQETGVHASSRG